MNKNLLLLGLAGFVAYRMWVIKLTNEQPSDSISFAADKSIWAGNDANKDTVDQHYLSNMPSGAQILDQMANEEETQFAGCMC